VATDFLVFYVLLAVLAVCYLVLGTVQAFAIAAGLKQRGFRGWQAGIMAVLIAYLPFVGSAAAMRNAAVGWGWSMRRGAIGFFGPLLLILAVLLLG
jgi:hypothetical protein